MDISLAQLRRHRLAKSGLLAPFASPEECVRRLVAVQAQVTQAAALAVGNRVNGFSYREYRHRLYEKRTLVRAWGQRNTVQVFDSGDWPDMTEILRKRRSWAFKEFIERGGTEEGYLSKMETLRGMLEKRDRLTRTEIAEGIGLVVSSWGGILVDAAYRGLLCDSGDNTFSPGVRWAAQRSAGDEALARRGIVRRFLETYGPATPADIVNWLGDRAGPVRAALDGLELQPVTCEGRKLIALRSDLPHLAAAASEPESTLPVILLYRFDPLLVAYRDKEWLVPEKHTGKVWAPAGHINGVIVENGAAVGTWKYVKKGALYRVEPTMFSRRKTGTAIRDAMKKKEAYLADFFRPTSERIQF